MSFDLTPEEMYSVIMSNEFNKLTIEEFNTVLSYWAIGALTRWALVYYFTGGLIK